MKSAKLKDLPIQIIDGDRSPRYPKRDEFQEDGILFLNTTNIIDNRLDLSDANYISHEKFSQLSKGKLQPLDIVMTTRGSIGKVALFNHSHHRTGFINAQMLIFRSDGKVIDPFYLYYLLCSSNMQGLIKNFASGSAQPQIPITDLREIEIDYPDFPTQRRIANILSAYDNLIENNTRRIRILEEMAQAIYQEWFGKVDKESLPKGWEEKTLGDIAQDIRRNVHPNDIDPETPYFGLEHLPRKSLALSEWGKAGDVQSTKLAFKKGEILFGKIRPYFHKVGVAPLDGVASSDTIIITPKSQEYFGIVLGCVFSEEFVNHATQTSQGTKMPRANWDVLVKYPVLVPPKKLLEQFNTTTKDFVELIQNLLFRNRNLRQTRDLLLPRLVSGEIEIE